MSEPFVGEIRMFAGSFTPRGWAACDGQTIAISQNDILFSLLGTAFGGDGRTTFGLPDMRGRVPMHAGDGPALSPRPLGARFGSEAVPLTDAQIPAHTHTLQANSQLAADGRPSNALPAQTPAGAEVGVYRSGPNPASIFSLKPESVETTGASRPHNNLMPYLCINFIIALAGIYPSRY